MYCLLLDVYYTAEKPLPADERAVFRLVGARSDEERIAVRTILGEFFVSEPGAYRQLRCDEEIANKQEKSAKNQDTGKMGGRPKLITDSVIPENPAGLRLVHDRTETVLTSETSDNPSQEPIASSQETKVPDGTSAAGSPALPNCPHLELIGLFGKNLPTLPQPKPELWDGKDAENMRARWRWVLTARRSSSGQRYATNRLEALDFFDRFFAYVAKSDFLSGRSSDFTCSLQWLMKAANFTKVVQGNYENKAAA